MNRSKLHSLCDHIFSRERKKNPFWPLSSAVFSAPTQSKQAQRARMEIGMHLYQRSTIACKIRRFYSWGSKLDRCKSWGVQWWSHVRHPRIFFFVLFRDPWSLNCHTLHCSTSISSVGKLESSFSGLWSSKWARVLTGTQTRISQTLPYKLAGQCSDQCLWADELAPQSWCMLRKQMIEQTTPSFQGSQSDHWVAVDVHTTSG